jgi:predicted thioesterase
MNLSTLIQPGMFREETFLVEAQHSAAHIGSGAVRVLATPMMILFMEQTCHRLLAQHLPDGQSSVGVAVNIRHLAATPVGQAVRVRSEVLAVDGRRVTFAVRVDDEAETVGEGQHERVVIDLARFLSRVEAKAGGAL